MPKTANTMPRTYARRASDSKKIATRELTIPTPVIIKIHFQLIRRTLTATDGRNKQIIHRTKGMYCVSSSPKRPKKSSLKESTWSKMLISFKRSVEPSFVRGEIKSDTWVTCGSK